MEAAPLLMTLIGLAGFLMAAIGCRKRVLDSADRASVSLLADGVLTIGALVVAAELLGAFGLFTPAAVAVTGVSLGLASLLPGRMYRRLFPLWPGFGPVRPAPAGLVGLSTLLVIFTWSGEIGRSLEAGIYLQDSTWYHLPFSAGFVQDGRIGELQQTDPMSLAAWFYPQDSEILHAWGMLAFGDEFLSVFLNLGFAGMTLAAAWVIGSRTGSSAWTLIAATTLLITPTLVIQAGNAPNDVVTLAFLATSAAFLLESARDWRERGFDLPLLVIAGLAAGLAIGVKLTALIPMAVITGGVILLGRPNERRRASLAWLGAVAVTGAYWYLRNLVLAGNPFPWVRLGPLPAVEQPDIYPRPDHSLVDYLRQPDEFASHIIPAVDDALGAAWPLILAGAIVGVGLVFWRRRVDPMAVLGIAGLTSAVAYVLNPISASGDFGEPVGFVSNLRYLTPALFLGLMCLMVELGHPGGKARTAARGLTVVALSVTFLSSLDLDGTATLVALALGLLFGIGFLAFRVSPGPFRAMLACLAIGTTALFVFIAQPRYFEVRFDPDRIPHELLGGFRANERWDEIQAWGLAQRDSAIAIVGPAAVYGQYVLMGKDLSNRVEYLGDPVAHGGLRPVTDCESLRRRVNGIDADYVVSTPLPDVRPAADTREAWWLRGDPGATEILRASPGSVFRISGRLDPALCETGRQVRMVPNPWGGSSPVSQATIPGPR